MLFSRMNSNSRIFHERDWKVFTPVKGFDGAFNSNSNMSLIMPWNTEMQEEVKGKQVEDKESEDIKVDSSRENSW